MRTSFGACVARAKLHARFGKPMPTKTTSLSTSSCAAAHTICSALEAIIHAGAHPRLGRQAFADRLAQASHIAGPISNPIDEFIQPARERAFVARNLVPRHIKIV